MKLSLKGPEESSAERVQHLPPATQRMANYIQLKNHQPLGLDHDVVS